MRAANKQYVIFSNMLDVGLNLVCCFYLGYLIDCLFLYRQADSVDGVPGAYF